MTRKTKNKIFRFNNKWNSMSFHDSFESSNKMQKNYKLIKNKAH